MASFMSALCVTHMVMYICIKWDLFWAETMSDFSWVHKDRVQARRFIHIIMSTMYNVKCSPGRGSDRFQSGPQGSCTTNTRHTHNQLFIYNVKCSPGQGYGKFNVGIIRHTHDHVYMYNMGCSPGRGYVRFQSGPQGWCTSDACHTQ